MLRIILSLLLFSAPAVAETEVEEVRWPSYCIRLVTINEDGTFLLDMPGWPYGMNDRPMLVQTMDRLENVTNCSPDDPRMNLE